jgi:RHS repeat-associated protein
VTFVWDAASQRTAMADLTGRTSWVYDKDGRTSRMQTPAGKIVTYGYDAASQRTRWVTPDGGYFTTTYDGVGRRVNLVNPDGDRTSWTYDNGDRTLAQRLANSVRASYTWNDADQLTRLVNITSGGTTISSFAYRLDGTGNRLGVTEADGTRVTWTYDTTYQLTHEQRDGTNAYNVTYQCDPVNNRLRMLDGGTPTTYSYDPANQLSTWKDSTGATTVTFDANGNQLVTNSASAGRTTNTWDFENKLTKVTLPSATRNTMQYDGDGKRVQKIDSAGTTNFVWDEQNVLQEADQTNTTQVTYTLEPLTYGNLISQNRGGTKGYYHYEAVGSTQQLTSTTASILNSYVYRAFGTLQASSETVANAYKFVGRNGYYGDIDTGQAFVRARYYRPALARWLIRDPVREGANHYVYARNTPTLATDPSGAVIEITAKATRLGKQNCAGSPLGGTFVGWNFKLNPPATCDGYLIQKVSVSCFVQPCKGCDPCNVNLDSLSIPTATFWEAWDVKAGKDIPVAQDEGITVKGQQLKMPFTDLANSPNGTGSCGLVASHGEVRFYCKEDTKDLGKTGTSGLWKVGTQYPIGGNCPTTNAGVNPSTGKEPDFWKGPWQDGPAYRSFYANWNCCAGKDDYSGRAQPD